MLLLVAKVSVFLEKPFFEFNISPSIFKKAFDFYYDSGKD